MCCVGGDGIANLAIGMHCSAMCVDWLLVIDLLFGVNGVLY